MFPDPPNAVPALNSLDPPGLDPGTHQASLSITNSQSLLKLMSIESVMPSSHLILCHPLLLLPGSSPGGSREFEVGTASARIRKQLLN